MILTVLALAYVAFHPRWSVLVGVACIVAIIQAGVLSWTLGLSADLSLLPVLAPEIARAIGLNMCVFLPLGVIIVVWRQQASEKERRELALLASLTQKSAGSASAEREPPGP